MTLSSDCDDDDASSRLVKISFRIFSSEKSCSSSPTETRRMCWWKIIVFSAFYGCWLRKEGKEKCSLIVWMRDPWKVWGATTSSSSQQTSFLNMHKVCLWFFSCRLSLCLCRVRKNMKKDFSELFEGKVTSSEVAGRGTCFAGNFEWISQSSF